MKMSYDYYDDNGKYVVVYMQKVASSKEAKEIAKKAGAKTVNVFYENRSRMFFLYR